MALNVGRLPSFMYESTTHIRLNYGTQARLCGSWMAVPAAGFPDSDLYLIHEIGHTIDPVFCGGITPAEWSAAVAADDSVSVTSYAGTSRHEDVAEMTWAWMMTRCVPDRFHPAYQKYIELYVGNRLTLLDREWLQKDWTPYSCKA